MTAPLASRRVVDAPTRVVHWTLALCFLGAYLSAESEHWRVLHVTLGYTMAGLVCFRLLYGVFGPQQSALSKWWRQALSLKEWLLQACRNLRLGRPVPASRQVLHMLMGALILSTLILIVLLTFSGYGAFNDWGNALGGDWIAQMHELFGNFLLAIICLHIAVVAILSVLQKRNLVLPMLHGRQFGKGPDLVQNNRMGLAIALLASVAAWFVWQWLFAGA